MHDWQRQFRLHIVEVLPDIPQGGPDLKLMCDIAEAVAVEVGPELRSHGWDEARGPAELFAAHRACYLLANANRAAGLEQMAFAGVGSAGDREEIARLESEYEGEPLFRAAFARHAHLFDESTRVAYARIEQRILAARHPPDERVVPWLRLLRRLNPFG
ncbi:MAG TPA: hypothetical protein VF710_22530 [Longimicrobium sp.]|jgi:hypothetical protein